MNPVLARHSFFLHRATTNTPSLVARLNMFGVSGVISRTVITIAVGFGAGHAPRDALARSGFIPKLGVDLSCMRIYPYTHHIQGPPVRPLFYRESPAQILAACRVLAFHRDDHVGRFSDRFEGGPLVSTRLTTTPFLARAFPLVPAYRGSSRKAWISTPSHAPPVKFAFAR
jgi:hypothetical protein